MTTPVSEEGYTISTAVYYRGHAQTLLGDLRRTRRDLRYAYNHANRVVESNLARGTRVAGRRRPVLKLALDQLESHMQLRKQRAETHRKLVVVNRLLGIVTAGLQRGDDFVPGKSKHLAHLVNMALRFAQSGPTKTGRFEADVATKIINQHGGTLLLAAFKRIHPHTIQGDLESKPATVSDKDRLLAKILEADLLTQREKTLLHQVFMA